MQYGDDFKAAFQSWTITIDDGNNSVLSYTEAAGNDGSTPIYWYFEEEKINAIKVNIRAKTKDGNTVSESRIFKKSDASESYENISDFFGGGDAVVIKMGAIAASSGYVTGITINTDISFEDVNGETVTIPVDGESIIITPDPEPEPEPSDDAPSFSCIDNGVDIFQTGISYSMSAADWNSNLKILINTPKKMKSLKVTIVGGNEGFSGTVDEMGFTDRELVGDTELESLLGGLGVNVPMPKAGVTSYEFPIGQFFTMMNIYGPTVDADQTEYDPDGKEYHTFSLTVTDEAGNTTGPVKLNVTIKK